MNAELRRTALQVIALALCSLLLGAALAWGQDVPEAATLTAPTLVPTVESQLVDMLPAESGVARIAREAVVRIGILYNEPPFGELNVRGELSGFDADLGRAMAEAWGVTPQFVQATRQTGIDLLVAGEIDMLLAAQPHLRDLDSRVEFSEAYFPSAQMMLVRESDAAQSLADMAGRRIGYVMGTRGERALQEWTTRSGVQVAPVPFVNFDQMLAALNSGTIDGLIETRVRVLRSVTQPGIARFIDAPVMPEPFAVAVRRQDVNLRNLIDRTLQFFLSSGKLNEIHRANFNNVDYPADVLIAWANVGDAAPQPGQSASDVPYPPMYIIPRLQSDRTLRVAGIEDVSADAPESQRRLDAAHRALINEIARRWNVSVVYVPLNGASAADLVASGQADLAVGLTPDWNVASRVDFTEPYMMHGLQLMVETSLGIRGFGDLRGKAVGTFSEEPGGVEALRAQAERSRAIVDDVFQLANESDAAFSVLAATDVNLAAVFGDSMRLLPHLQNNPDTLSLLSDADGHPIYFTREVLAMATPRNDLDFHLLVEYTLQEMQRDGSLVSLLSPVALPGAIPPRELWPGANSFLGFSAS